MDFVLRGSFEWRELANLMSGFELRHGSVDRGAPSEVGSCEAEIAEATCRAAVALAHRSRPFARHVVRLLACVHGSAIEDVRRAARPALQARTAHPRGAEDVGFYWALLSDPREDVAALAHAWDRRGARPQG
jgi:hypothetical protein